MNQEDRVRIAVVGCGRIGGTYLEVCGEIEEARLAAVVDSQESARWAASQRHGVPAHAAVSDLVRAGDADAAIVCTPPVTHGPVTLELLEAGLHVICEKPFAMSVAEGGAMVEAAERNQRVLMMASKFRYVEDVSKAKGILDSGILGKIVLFENIFCSRVDMRGRWNADPAVSGGGVLIDNGSHSVDIARYLLGPIVEVQAQHGVRAQEIEVEDTSQLLLRCASGVMGSVDLSWSIHKEVDSYINLYGSQGTLRIGWQGSRYRQSEKNEWVPFGAGYDKAGALRSQVRNFVRSIRGSEMPVITGVDGLASVRVIEAAYRSGSQNHWAVVDA